MELQFNKTVIPYLDPVVREMQTQEQTQEVRLTDGLPDIGRVLACWGQILVRGKEWRSGSAGVSSGVMVWVLYAPEDGSEPQSVEAWLPFQMKWTFPDTGRDGSLMVIPCLRGVDARSVSARKIMVRANVAMFGRAMVPTDGEIYTPVELPSDVQILKKTYPMLIPAEAGEKTFSLDESLQLPSSVPAVDKLIRYNLRPVLTDSKVMSDKLIMQATVYLDVLYRGVDGQLHGWSFELPASQYAQLDRDYDTNAQAQIDLAVTALELEQGEEENLNFKAGITAQYVIYDRMMVDLVEDAYSPSRNVTVQMAELKLPVQLESRMEAFRAEQTVETQLQRVADTVFYQDQPQLYTQEDQLTAELSGYFQMLGYDADGQLQGASSRWQGSWSDAADSDVNVVMMSQPDGVPEATFMGTTAQLRADMQLNLQTMSDRGMPMVMGMELGETVDPDPERPSLILRRAGEDSLWDIAKMTGSTVEAIKTANNLEQEPDSNRMLLIPVS